MKNISNILLSKYEAYIQNIQELNSESEYLEEEDMINYIDKLKLLTNDFEQIVYKSNYSKIMDDFKLKLKKWTSYYKDIDSYMINIIAKQIYNTIDFKSYMLKGDRYSYVLRYKYKLFNNIIVEAKWFYVNVFPFDSETENVLYVNKEIFIEENNEKIAVCSKFFLDKYFSQNCDTNHDKLKKKYYLNKNMIVKKMNDLIVDIHEYIINDLYKKDFFLPIQIGPNKYTSLYLVL